MYKQNTHIKEIIARCQTPYQQLMEVLGCGQAQALRLKRGDYLPKVDTLIKLAEMYHTNVSYLLDRTECDAPCSRYILDNRLMEVLKEKEMTSKMLAAKSEMGYPAIWNFVADPAYTGRRETWVKFSDVLDLSIDYLMGLTDEPHWETLAEFFSNFPVPPGWAGYMNGPAYQGTFLVSTDGWWLIFPDGTKEPITAYKYRFSQIVELLHPQEANGHE